MNEENHISTPAQLAREYIQHTSCNIFLTGKAGTGKTTFLRNIVKQTYKNVVITAPTGIAAINAGGVTLHSFFQLPFGSFVPEVRTPDPTLAFKLNDPVSLIRNIQIRDAKRKTIRSLELLIIDEVSMLRADLLDAIDVILRHIRRNRTQPFGGVQVLFIGDMYQLPPVVKDDEWRVLREYYPSQFFFDAKVLRENKPIYIELDKIYRQEDPIFIRLLNNLRNNTLEPSDSELLQKFYQPGFRPDPKDKFINLTTHNAKASQRNSEELNILSGKSYRYQALVTGDFPEYLYPIEYEMELKVGAQVMFIKNDPTGERRFFNGKIGEIASLTDEEIEVSTGEYEKVIVERYIWENVRYELNEETQLIEENVIGTFSQYPLRLAWAITVHKSQGLTFDRATIDVNEAFAPGQIYVALSRLRSLDGLVLTTSIQKHKLQVDNQICAYSQSKKDVDELQQILKTEKDQYSLRMICDSFSFTDLIKHTQDFTYNSEDEEAKTAKLKYRQWALSIINQLKELETVGSKFQNQITYIFCQNSEDSRKLLTERLKAAQSYFDEKILETDNEIFLHLARVLADKRVKTYQKEVQDFETLLYSFLVKLRRNVMLAVANFNNEEISKDKLIFAAQVEGRHEKIRELIILEKQFEKLEKGNKKKKNRKKLNDDEVDYVDISTPSHKLQKEKGPSTSEVSYSIFQQGKSVAEVAQERALTQETIIKHLIPYLQNGEINIEQLVDPEKIHIIKSTINEIEFTGLKDLKTILPEDFSYDEIRLVMVSMKNE